MHAIVVYESHWGNTAAVARAVAEGLGPEARALTTTEATPDVVATADLVVAGSPVMAFGLPTEAMAASSAKDSKAPVPADVSHPSLRDWLDALRSVVGPGARPGAHPAAAFETKLWWSLGGATGPIESRLRKAGFRTVARGEKFVVKGAYGPLREGELERARAWGESLARSIQS
jgi:flavorubredoxin